MDDPQTSPRDGHPVLELAGVGVRIGSSTILRGISFSVASRGVTALLGRNGAGKTTTVRAILGLVPHTGTIRLAGRDISDWPTHRIVRHAVGYAPEDRGVFTGLTVAENLLLAERPGVEHDYDTVYALFPELRGRTNQAAGTLSGGQQQMLAIARILLNPNRLLIADEPTKGLAPQIVSEVADVLDRTSEAVPVLLVEQNVAMVRRIAATAVVLAAGQVTHAGPAGELVADAQRARALLGVTIGPAARYGAERPA